MSESDLLVFGVFAFIGASVVGGLIGYSIAWVIHMTWQLIRP